MHQKEQSGFASSLLVSVILGVLLLLAVMFGVWAFVGREDYKANSDQKAADAVAAAEAAQRSTLQAEFDEKSKSPYETFQGPATLGSVKFDFPKTWEMYADSGSSSGASLNAYAHPGYVPGINNDSVAYALRMQVLERDYATELKGFDSSLKAGKVKVTPFRAPNVQSVLGSRIDGEVIPKKTGHMIIVPLRDKTLKIWTESDAYSKDFDMLLTSLTFSP